MTPLPKSPTTKIAKGSTLSLSLSKENSHKKKYKGKKLEINKLIIYLKRMEPSNSCMNKESRLNAKIGFHAKNNQMNRTSKYSMSKSPTYLIIFLKSMNMEEIIRKA